MYFRFVPRWWLYVAALLCVASWLLALFALPPHSELWRRLFVWITPTVALYIATELVGFSRSRDGVTRRH